jgi:hypothetical protein
MRRNIIKTVNNRRKEIRRTKGRKEIRRSGR